MAEPMATDMKLRTIVITLCQACLDGEGEECHTPGCAMFLHRVDLPFAPESYEVLAEFDEDAPMPSAQPPAQGDRHDG